MSRISEETIERVVAASDVVDVLGSYLQLKRAGSSWRALCPFHQEKTPSFHVNPARQSFHCFGCGAGGGVLRFVMDYEHVDFPTAVRRLAQRAGIPILDESPGDQARRSDRDRMLALHRDAAAWFHSNLMRRPSGAGARDYLKARGINSETAGRWQLGFAPDEWTALADWAGEKGYAPAELAQAGLVSARDGRDGVYDRFRNRVMFPIRSDYGEVIAFSGRTLGDDPAKYVNSPETPIFTKGRVLFGLDKTKRAIIEANEAIVCEGQLDLISAFEAGVQNVIAPQGTAFTAEQARLLRRFAESVVLCFDSDTAGLKAAERSLPTLLASGLAVKLARMPAGEDPDSLIRGSGAGAFRSVIAGAGDYFDDALDRGGGPESSAQSRGALAEKLADFVSCVRDPLYREALLNRIRTRLEFSMGAFNEILRRKKREDIPDQQDAAPVSIEVAELSERARLLCRLAIASMGAREWIRAQTNRAVEFGEEFALLDKIVASSMRPDDPNAFAAFAASLPGPEERALGGLRLDHLPPDPVSATSEAWTGLEAQRVRDKIASLQAAMRRPDARIEDADALHKQILDLQGRLGDF